MATRPRLIAAALAALTVAAACAGSPSSTSAPPAGTTPATSDTAGSAPSSAVPSSATSTDAPSTPPTPTPTPGPTFEADVPFTPMIPCAADPAWQDAICQLQFDIAAPPPGTGTHPIAVLLRGGPDKPHAIDYLADTARALADRGVVALVADWRESPDYAGGGRTGLQDVACAIGVARQIGPAYGGDPGNVTVVGHSLGGWSGGLVALSPETFTPKAGECDETAGSLRPDAFVSIEGWVPAEVSDAAPRHPKRPLPILVIQTEGDPAVAPAVARQFTNAMTKRGYAPKLTMLPGGDHISALFDDGVLDAIAALATG